ncbi:unnamed protein product [Rangifer tarandus platyrhynchus]|uniref:Uncharacterized protein n=2 Tax=Rangifer tarandus platyrhynchus TaxID=3082113 RepID=A0ABN8Y5V8_RANTA|nr:unnamed protein product [Rangifer tarandus platyrhynchus]CAI9692813.1 unnamed protein product [Rangifer tarandus platyrhynchus]
MIRSKRRQPVSGLPQHLLPAESSPTLSRTGGQGPVCALRSRPSPAPPAQTRPQARVCAERPGGPAPADRALARFAHGHPWKEQLLQ